ncbi:MAG: YdcF family protein [Moorea sp. SIO1F2]|uniref:ElyC/SanA/YdcF family protein n=1 Tax=Moorena sp. SIO1F2 TaxID=2607819 RepID=UPI0013BA4175|nr:ElyC/SanA/YdcF family protein [Moorena sp. SIO1F2]NET82922.1 YdcF family protein [Moorena sp. SIO1F2]
MLTHIHPFLSIKSPINADALVVEGWLPDYALKGAMEEFDRGNYQKLITTGPPLRKGYYLSHYKTYAELTAATCIALGVEPDKLVAVPAPDVNVNRTLASAQALREWLLTSDESIKSINLYSFDVHTRRSWLIFKQVLAPEFKVGAIAANSLDYEPKQWWVSSQGVRSIMSETIAYIYAQVVSWKV